MQVHLWPADKGDFCVCEFPKVGYLVAKRFISEVKQRKSFWAHFCTFQPRTAKKKKRISHAFDLTLLPETPRPFSMVERYLNTPSCRAVLPILLITGLDSSGLTVCLSRTQANNTGQWWGMSPSVSSSWSISWRKDKHQMSGASIMKVYVICHRWAYWVPPRTVLSPSPADLNSIQPNILNGFRFQTAGILWVNINAAIFCGSYKLKSNLNDIGGTRILVLFCTILQSTFVQEVNVHSLNQDERAQVSAGQRNKRVI